MAVLGGILLFISLVGLIVFLVLGVVALIKKNGSAKKKFLLSLVSFVVMVISFIIIGLSSDTSSSSNAETSR